MSGTVRVSYADAKICTERLPELAMGLMEKGFALQWVEVPIGRGHYVIVDEPCLERDVAGDAQ